MSEIYKKFCNSMDAFDSYAAFKVGTIGMIIMTISFITQSFSFIPTSVSNNAFSGFLVVGLLLILVTVFRLAIYPLLRFNN